MADLKYGAKGKSVEKLQRALLSLGYDLPRWGADGDLGTETWNAVRRYAEAHGITLVDGVPGEVIPGSLVQEILTAAESFDPPTAPSQFFDVTDRHEGAQRRGVRPWSRVTGIVLHQTAILISSNVERWFGIAAHIGIPRDGKIILMNPLNQLIWHANAFNRSTVGIEISGNFEGIDKKPSTLWEPGGGPHRANEAQIQAARDAITWICEAVSEQGGKIRNLYAHRQASMDRRADPGSRVWKEVGLWGQQTLGLSDGGPGYVNGGRPIPRDWDESRTEAY